MKSQLIGTAVGLALCAALPACSQEGNTSTQDTAQASSGDPQIEWSSSLKEQLREIVSNAPANGLKPDLFLKGDGGDDNSLTQAAIRYAEALANGHSDPTKLYDVYTIPRPSADVRQALRQAVENGDLKSWFASLPPQTEEYRALSKAHLHYLQLASKSKFQPVPDGDPLKEGTNGERVQVLRNALNAMGYLNGQSQQKSSASRYTSEVAAAVKTLQQDFGLKTDGIVGGNTLEAVNLGPGGLARMTAIAMERLRWLQRDPPKTRIDVNTAATTLDYWRNGQHVDHRKVVAGQPDKQTPQLQSPMTTLVAYPTWTVPKSIAEEELAEKSQSWLNSNNFKMEDGQYVQQSGPENSLGIVKFDMQNDHAIYLHDTPAKSLFGLDDRHRSHGCVRVEDAVGFARAIAQQEGIAEQFSKAMDGKEQEFVKLPNEIPVRLLYQTAFWDGAKVQFRPDAYGWDDDVAKALGLVRGANWQHDSRNGDVGP